VIVILVGVSFFRPSTQRNRMFLVITALYVGMMAEAVYVSHMNDLEWYQRAAKLFLYLLLGLAVASGRVRARPLVSGLVCGMLANVPLFYAGLTPNAYPPFLTGYLTDKNISGLMYAVVGVLGLVIYRRTSHMLLHWIAFAGLLWLTGSRTSIAAFLFGTAWVLLRNRVWLGFRLTGIAGAVWLLSVLEDRYARIGVFADREGTDWFREQIGIATDAKLRSTPWFGRGLTTAWVNLDGGRFMWFHDSYAALRVEGGLPMLITMLILVAVLAGGVFRAASVSPTLAIVEGAVVVVLVCASKLGEVFFTTPSFLLLGLAWGLRYGIPIEDGDDSPAASLTPARGARRAIQEKELDQP